MNLFITLLIDHGTEEILTKNILLTLSNISLNRRTKSLYLGNTEFPGLVMHLITDPTVPLVSKLYGS